MTTEKSLKNWRVMLVDDDQSIRHSLSYYFRHKAGAFTALETAEQALNHLQEQAYDVIICDYRLPGMNGLDFFQELNRQNPQILKILITAFGSLEVALEAIHAGVQDFIMKPFQAAVVEHSIASLIAKREKEIAGILVDGKPLSGMAANRLEHVQFIVGKTSHRIKNTVQGILGNAEMGLVDAQGNQAVSKRFDRIIGMLGDLQDSAKEMVAVSRTKGLQPEMVNTAALVDRCIEKYEDIIKNHQVKVYKCYMPINGIYTYAAYLDDIIDNIFFNALEALIEDKNSESELHLNVQNNGEDISIVIIDNGPGMGPKVLEKAIQRGFTTKPSGSGLGLYIVTTLLRELGGRINLESQLGKGTRVEIILPAILPDEKENKYLYNMGF